MSLPSTAYVTPPDAIARSRPPFSRVGSTTTQGYGNMTTVGYC
jgi:hypothetical protein